MSQTTPTIGLKKPEGSDPFLTEDFAANYDKIDAAFAARPAGGGSGGDASTLGGSPKSFFYGPHNPPPATGTSSHAHSEYAPIGHTHGSTGGTGITQAEADARYAPLNHGSHSGGTGTSYTEPGDLVKSPGRNQPRVVFTNTEVQFNGVNGVNGSPVVYNNAGFVSAPSVVCSAEVGSNWDMIVNVQGRTATNATARIARVTGAATTGTARIHWFIGGVAA